MFVGHYGVSFMARAANRRIPLWVLFIAVQLLDVIWAPMVLLGVEHLRIVPGITASNPMDLYHMPYTHSLVGAVVWSVVAWAAWRWWKAGQQPGRAAVVVGLCVFSHWVLDLIVHRPDLPLWDDRWKAGLGLWNYPAPALVLEAALLFVGMVLYWRGRAGLPPSLVVFGLVMLAVQAAVFFGPPPPSPAAAAIMAIVSYAAFAWYVWRWERRHDPPAVEPTR